jgi:bifunctional DNA-binding transcriptional regulator/antitoxin component of YhaV-PrlF toxin-antitoxin module
MSATAIREKRQTTLPADVSEAAGLEPGDQVEWRFEEGEIRGRKLAPKAAEELGVEDLDPKTLLPRKGKIVAESLIASIRADRNRR